VCDRLPVHVNDDVKEFARARGIIIVAIMPGSSHWFQVQDQQPFGTLKRKMEIQKSRFSVLPSLTSQKGKAFLRGLFTIVESSALACNIVLDSFEQVGLWPWNPDLIRELCQKHCPPPSPVNLTDENDENEIWEKLWYEIRAEREAEQDDIIRLGELMEAEPYKEEPRYAFRASTRPLGPDFAVEWRQFVHDKLTERR